ncbi:RNA exonuclease 1 homolog [Sciurus carolinensis]|uniref:RNA exonuclease 1 homolog n=1 Tax=Sciurus carolinensis TaxID=30640 RepID=UPI001FB427FF|nr:RNA exonuclease 1 homolog [Sciurus carolinensis]
MNLRPTSKSSFSTRYPEPSMVARAVDYPTQYLLRPCSSAQDRLRGAPHTCVQVPEFVVIQAETSRRGPAVPAAWPETNWEVFYRGALQAQRKPFCCLKPALRPTQPVPMSAPGEKSRPFHMYHPGLATAPTGAKRPFGTSSSQSNNGPKLSSGPQMCKWSGVTSQTTPIASVRMAHGPSSQGLRKPIMPKACKGKVSMAIRQRYFNQFMEECLKFSSHREAVETAWIEELVAYDSSPNENTYLLLALNTLRKLRGLVPSVVPGLNRAALYRRLQDYLLTEDQLKVNGYPFPHPKTPGAAFLFTVEEKPKKGRRICCRCGSEFAVSSSGRCVCNEVCHYHWGRLHRNLLAGGWETRYTCCFAALGSVGCRVAWQHVRDGRKENLEGFVKTVEKPFLEDAHAGIYALDCEMSYTTHGLELTRITVVDTEMQVIYDTFVKPDNEIVDYNTRFSGVTEEDIAFTSTNLRDVQAVLLTLFSADTILIGHSLESDLLALKVIHKTVVDTSVLFPHRRGFPYKRSLRNLMSSYLNQIIQDSVNGHSSREDASACMNLVLWKMQEDAKTSRAY